MFKKDVLKFFRFLKTLGVYRPYLNNLREYQRYIRSRRSIEYNVLKDFSSPGNLVIYAFDFAKTKEGDKFWYWVNDMWRYHLQYGHEVTLNEINYLKRKLLLAPEANT